MNKILTSNTSVLRWLVFAALASLGSTNIWAKDHAQRSIELVQTLSLSEGQASTMALKESGGKSYLEIQFASGEQACVNVTKPEKPLEATPSSTAEEHTQIDQNLVVVRAAVATDANRSTSQDFELWDLSKRRSPRLVGRFSGVVRVIDDQRGYIYVLHRDGLSVIRTKDKNNNSGPDYSIYG